jgi:hypothetical protein
MLFVITLSTFFMVQLWCSTSILPALYSWTDGYIKKMIFIQVNGVYFFLYSGNLNSFSFWIKRLSIYYKIFLFSCLLVTSVHQYFLYWSCKVAVSHKDIFVYYILVTFTFSIQPEGSPFGPKHVIIIIINNNSILLYNKHSCVWR